MDFSKNNKAIYLQITDSIFEYILSKKWKPEERIPSVRDFAVSIQVNPNTVMRAYTYLQEKEIIYNQRGIGFFVSESAYEKSIEIRKIQFVENELPNVFKNLDLLDMDISEIEKLYTKSKNKLGLK